MVVVTLGEFADEGKLHFRDFFSYCQNVVKPLPQLNVPQFFFSDLQNVNADDAPDDRRITRSVQLVLFVTTTFPEE